MFLVFAFLSQRYAFPWVIVNFAAVYILAFLAFFFAWNGRWRARKVLQWQLGVLVTEFGVLFTPIPVLISWWAYRSLGLSGLPAILISIATLGLLICPDLKSLLMERRVRRRLAATFGPAAIPAPIPPHARAVQGASFWRRLLSGVLGAFVRLREPVPARELTYPAADGVTRRMIFYPAEGRERAPCVVVMHTGGWESGTPEEFAGCHAGLARLGFSVASVEYGLTPTYSWPTPRDDLRAAIVFLKSRASELGLDPDNLVLLGRSAGGQVALCVAYDNPDPSVRGVAAFYAPTDMVFSWKGSYDGDMLDSPKLLSNYLGGRPHEFPEAHAEASPTRHADSGRPVPTLLLHGARDEIVWCLQVRRLARVLRRRGARHFALLIPWGRHGFDFRLRGPGGRIAWIALTAFIFSVTNK